jgi:RNA polymerase sigma-70 factor, ECF subfamily
MTVQDDAYQSAAVEFGRALERLAHGYEADPDRRRDLLQDIHFALWRSFAQFDGRCSTRTWVYRVAHNAAASFVLMRKRVKIEQQVDLEELEIAADASDIEAAATAHQAATLLAAMLRQLKPPDAQVMHLYLEDLDASEIAEVTGLSPGAVATRIHRVKTILAKRFQEGGRNGN